MSLFARETDMALKFIEQNTSEIRRLTPYLSQDERRMAMAIVAPEISMFSNMFDFLELRTLFITYRNFGRGNFSVGQFQMKPSFVEQLESEIGKNALLRKRYADMLPEGNDKEKRTTRLERLSTLEWQIKYLQVFIDVVKLKTAKMRFRNEEEKLRYWATLYNSGFNLSPERVAQMQEKKLFPHGSSRKFNYADVAQAFYTRLSPI